MSDSEGSPKRFLKSVLIAIVLFLVTSYFLAMLLGPVLFFFTPDGLAASRLHLQLFPIMLFAFIFFYVPVSINVGLLFSLLWVIYLVCFFAAWRYRESLQKTIRKVISHSPSDAFQNCLFAMPIISSVVLVLAISITLLEAASGIPSGNPPLPEDPFKAFILLTLAPVVEEIGFRLTPIGTFLTAYLFWFRRLKETTISRMECLKMPFVALLYPDGAKRMTGARNVSDFGVLGGISSGEWVMVVLTSVSFGLAHILGGWETGKFASASIQGFALGLTYLLYGIQAPIILHWFFNYYAYTYNLAAEIYPAMSPLISIINATTFMFGIFGLLSIAMTLIDRITGSRTKRTTPMPT